MTLEQLELSSTCMICSIFIIVSFCACPSPRSCVGTSDVGAAGEATGGAGSAPRHAEAAQTSPTIAVAAIGRDTANACPP
jgi:hypothetical protein